MPLVFSFNHSYPFKHWLTTLALGPVFICIYEVGNFYEFFYFYFIMFAFGFAYSLPAFLIYLIGFNLLNMTAFSPILLKTILNAAGIIGIVLTLYVAFDVVGLFLCLSYAVVLILSSFLFKIKKDQQ